MQKTPKPNKMTPQEYLDWEEKQPIKHEYMNGRVFAATEVTLPHNEISVNLAVALKTRLRAKGCKVLMTAAKVCVSETESFHYPDVMVTCDERDRRAIKFVKYPCLIVEVFSPETEAFDRGKKFQSYRSISTLKEYVLIDSIEMAVEHFKRNENGAWEIDNYGKGDEVNLTSVDFSFPIEMLYEDIILEGKENAWDILERLAGTVDAPEDWSIQHDHYLYGTPKRNLSDE